jgi:hypothetical protein
MDAGRDSPHPIFFSWNMERLFISLEGARMGSFLLLLPHLRLKNKKGLMKIKLSKFVKFIVNIINITSYYYE